MKKSTFNKTGVKRRLIVLFFLFILTMGALGVRVASINHKNNQQYQTSVLQQHVNNQTYNDVIPAKRGAIYDRNGILLAESIKVYNVVYDPGVLNQHTLEMRNATNNFLYSVSVLSLEPNVLENLLTNKPTSHYEVIARGLEYDMVKNIDAAIQNGEIKGVFLEGYYKRIYPYNTMAADVIGFYNPNTGGNYGIEEYYNDALSGMNGRLFGSLDSENILRQEEVPAIDGYNLELTIDFSIQRYVEEAIAMYYEEHDAISVNVIVMNPQNGEILAMSSSPTFDLNNPYAKPEYFTDEQWASMSTDEQFEQLFTLWRNYNITDSYEPGSTFKPFVLSLALDEGMIGINHTFECTGYKVMYGHVIRCWKAGGHGLQTAGQALANSCNVAFMDMGAIIGRDYFYDYQQLFGFGNHTNIDLVGEGNSILYTRAQLNDVELATSSFGQGFNITPIQLITAFSSLVNGGYLYEPHVMKKITDNDGKIIDQNGKEIIRQVLSNETSEMITDKLTMVVDVGTGKKASVEGYKIGGKTGTAEKGNRDEDRYIISFIGFAQDHPEVMTLVVIDEPAEEDPSSSECAEVFSNIMSKVLPYLKIYPENTSAIDSNQAVQDNINNEETPSTDETLQETGE